MKEKLSGHVQSVFSAQIVQVLINFICSILLVRIFGSYGQGEWAIYNVNMNAFNLIAALGIPPALVHFISSEKIKRNQCIAFLSSLLLVSGILLALCILGVMMFMPSLQSTFIQENKLWYLILGVHTILLIIQQVVVALMHAEKLFRTQSLVAILGSTVYLIGMIWVYYYTNGNFSLDVKKVVLVLLISLFIQLPFLVYALIKKNRQYAQAHSFSIYDMHPIVQFGFLVFCTNLFQFFNYKADIWLLNYFNVQKSDLGIYALAASLVQLIWMFPQAIQTVLFPKISRHQAAQIPKMSLQKPIQAIFFYCVLVMVISVLSAQFVIPFVFGSEFNHSVRPFLILLLGALPFCFTMPVSAYFSGTNKVSINLYSALLGFIVCILFNIILIPKYGIQGAAIASVASYVATSAYLFWKYKKIASQ